MAEGDGVLYNNFKEQILLKELDLVDDVVRAMLVTGYTPDIDADVSYSDVSGDEVVGSGYTATGEVLGSKTVTQDDSNDRAVWDGADVTWTGLDVGTPSDLILYSDTHASKYLIGYFEIATASNGDNYTAQWNANGIMLAT